MRLNVSRQLALFIIVLLAIAIRFYQLGVIPVALNRDEASLGYNAYLLLKTGQEEHGRSWPLNLESFGDWKLPVYMYSLVPLISVFGLSEWTVRLPSALAGVGIVLAGYWLTVLFLEKKKSAQHLGLMVAFFLAVSPWSVHFSRIAYEANLAMLLFVLGCIFYNKALQRTKVSSWYVIFSAAAFSLTVFTYHSYQIVTPTFLLLLVLINYKELWQWWLHSRKTVLISVGIIVGSFLLLLFSQRTGANETKYKNISIFSRDIEAYEQSMTKMLLNDTHPVLAKLFASYPVTVGQRLYNNVISLFDPQFLFTQGGSHQSHNIPGFGNFHAFALLTLPAGIYVAVRKRESWQILLLAWILAAMIPPLLTYSLDVSANHSTRFSAALVPLEMMSAYGLWTIISFARKHLPSKFALATQTLSAAVIFYSVLFFLSTYFFIYPVRDIDRWPWYMKQVVQIVNSRSVEVEQVIMTGESSSPYIYFLFYAPDQYLPITDSLAFYPATDEGFRHAQQLGKITFGSVDWNSLEKERKSTLIALQEKEIPIDKLNSQNYLLVDTISDSYSALKYVILKYEP